MSPCVSNPGDDSPPRDGAATVYLSAFARVDYLSVADVDRALYDEQSLVKQLALRRTLFVFPRGCTPRAPAYSPT